MTVPVNHGDPVDRATYVYARGDYGIHHATELAELVEQRNCEGCRHGTHRGDYYDCDLGLLIRLIAEVPIPQFDPRPDGIVCTARVSLDEPEAPAILDGQEAMDL